MSLNVNFTRVSGRLAKIIAALALIGTALAGLRGGWTWALGFFLGAAASYLNYRNLVQIVRSPSVRRTPPVASALSLGYSSD